MSDPAVSVIAEAELSAAPPGCTARLLLDPGSTDAEVAAVACDLAQGVLSHIQAMLVDPATDLPADARCAGRTRRRAERADQWWGHRHRAEHPAGPGVASPSRRAGLVRNPA